MGNCNSQDFSKALEDRCSSGGSRRARRRASSSTSGSSSSSSENKKSTPKPNCASSALANAKENRLPNSNSVQLQDGKVGGGTTDEYRGKTIVIDEASATAMPEEADLAGKHNPTTINNDEHKSESGGAQLDDNGLAKGNTPQEPCKVKNEQADGKEKEERGTSNGTEKLDMLKGEFVSFYVVDCVVRLAHIDLLTLIAHLLTCLLTFSRPVLSVSLFFASSLVRLFTI